MQSIEASKSEETLNGISEATVITIDETHRFEHREAPKHLAILPADWVLLNLNLYYISQFSCAYFVIRIIKN
jgi:hypothetical protein